MAQARDSCARPGVRDYTQLPLFRLAGRTATPAKRTARSAAGHLKGVSMPEGTEATQTALAHEQELFIATASIRPWQWSAWEMRLVHSAPTLLIRPVGQPDVTAIGTGAPLPVVSHFENAACCECAVSTSECCSLWSTAGDRIEHDRPLIHAQYNVLESSSPHGSDDGHWGPKQRQLQAVCHPRVGEQRRLFHCSL